MTVKNDESIRRPFGWCKYTKLLFTIKQRL